MKKLLTSLLIAISALSATVAAADTFTINNNAAYNLEVQWHQWKNNYGEHVFDDFLLAGQSLTFDNAKYAWVKVRAHIPGYGFNHINLTPGDTNTVLDAYGTTFTPSFNWGTR